MEGESEDYEYYRFKTMEEAQIFLEDKDNYSIVQWTDNTPNLVKHSGEPMILLFDQEREIMRAISNKHH